MKLNSPLSTTHGNLRNSGHHNNVLHSYEVQEHNRNSAKNRKCAGDSTRDPLTTIQYGGIRLRVDLPRARSPTGIKSGEVRQIAAELQIVQDR
ncbi:hypothetical protein IRJ41_004079 [Triplophysa rosa]|uniref:Uncharacterized protein n=1 Tax=Triplophysa rosa TaxID=992332 RepID=A0A9W8C6C4_TRIRA|nr:hypothetical protein IRJ41_004079 [Triplophysa rosa]